MNIELDEFPLKPLGPNGWVVNVIDIAPTIADFIHGLVSYYSGNAGIYTSFHAIASSQTEAELVAKSMATFGFDYGASSVVISDASSVWSDRLSEWLLSSSSGAKPFVLAVTGFNPNDILDVALAVAASDTQGGRMGVATQTAFMQSLRSNFNFTGDSDVLFGAMLVDWWLPERAVGLSDAQQAMATNPLFWTMRMVADISSQLSQRVLYDYTTTAVELMYSLSVITSQGVTIGPLSRSACPADIIAANERDRTCQCTKGPRVVQVISLQDWQNGVPSDRTDHHAFTMTTCGLKYTPYVPPVIPYTLPDSAIIGIAVGATLGLISIIVGGFLVNYYCFGRNNRAAPKDASLPFAIVFTDIQSSTALWARAPSAMSEAVEQHHSIIRSVIRKHNGYEVKTIGDSFMVAFKEADDAVAFGLDVQQALFDAEWNSEINACYLEILAEQALAAERAARDGEGTTTDDHNGAGDTSTSRTRDTSVSRHSNATTNNTNITHANTNTNNPAIRVGSVYATDEVVSFHTIGGAAPSPNASDGARFCQQAANAYLALTSGEGHQYQHGNHQHPTFNQHRNTGGSEAVANAAAFAANNGGRLRKSCDSTNASWLSCAPGAVPPLAGPSATSVHTSGRVSGVAGARGGAHLSSHHSPAALSSDSYVKGGGGGLSQSAEMAPPIMLPSAGVLGSGGDGGDGFGPRPPPQHNTYLHGTPPNAALTGRAAAAAVALHAGGGVGGGGSVTPLVSGDLSSWVAPVKSESGVSVHAGAATAVSPNRLSTLIASSAEDYAATASSANDLKIWNGIRVRIGISFGFGEIRKDPVTLGYDYYGTVVNTAARVEGVGHGGQVLITEETLSALERDFIVSRGGVAISLGPQPLRGLDAPIKLTQISPAGLQPRKFPPLRLHIEVDDVNAEVDTDKSATTGSSAATLTPLEVARQLCATKQFAGVVSVDTLLMNYTLLTTLFTPTKPKWQTATIAKLGQSWGLEKAEKAMEHAGTRQRLCITLMGRVTKAALKASAAAAAATTTATTTSSSHK